jgi:hypothetical protein
VALLPNLVGIAKLTVGSYDFRHQLMSKPLN